jgi:hypothetical protein
MLNIGKSDSSTDSSTADVVVVGVVSCGDANAVRCTDVVSFAYAIAARTVLH